MPASFLFLDWRADQRGVQRREVAPCSSYRLLDSVRRLLPGRGGRDVHHVRDGELALATEPSKDLRPAGGGSGPTTELPRRQPRNDAKAMATASPWNQRWKPMLMIHLAAAGDDQGMGTAGLTL